MLLPLIYHKFWRASKSNIKKSSINLFQFISIDGKEANESPNAAKIIADGIHAFELAQEKRNAENAGRQDPEVTFHNAYSFLCVLTQLAKGFVVQFPQFVKKTVDGASNGFADGLKQGGLAKGITSALKESTKGLQNGALTAFANIERDTMRL